MDDDDRRILYSGETQLMDWGQSRTSGSWIKLWVHDDDLEAFKVFKARTKGQAGQRLGTVMVQIGDDEAIVEHHEAPAAAPAPAPVLPPPRPTRSYQPHIGDLGMVAVRWCKDADFHRWMMQQPLMLECEERSDALHDALRAEPMKPEAVAKAFILAACHVEELHGVHASRRHLDVEPMCTAAFHALIRIPFRDWLIEEGIQK